MSGRKRKEPGLFGIAKTKSVLFTFNPRKGEECSSDSEDSDYFPGRQSTDEDDEEILIERKRTKLVKQKVKKAAKLASAQTSKQSRKRTNSEARNEVAVGDPPKRLPPEILLRIFMYGAQSEGVTRFLPRVSRVCKEWHDIVSDPSLLKYLDLSFGGAGSDCTNVITFTKQRLDMLLSSRDISQCQFLSLTGQVKLAASNIKTMLSQTPRLASLDLRGCQINSDMLKRLPEMSPCLERIDLSHLSPSSNSLPFGPVEGLVTAFGSKLVELRLGGMVAIQNRLETMLKAITQCCPALEELDLSRPSSTSINFIPVRLDMGELARTCPRLTELRLDGLSIVDEAGETQPYNPAFLRLKIYSQSSHLCAPHEKPAIYRMFSNNELSELNISQTNLQPSMCFRESKGVVSVKRLNLSNMYWNRNETPEISTCLFSWFDSIEILDLSNNKRDWFNDELYFFALPEECSSTCVQAINLSNSVVSSENVVNILKHCKTLQAIDLTACRELPRGCKRVFRNYEFPDLIESLST